jgi:hypothetical protein
MDSFCYLNYRFDRGCLIKCKALVYIIYDSNETAYLCNGVLIQCTRYRYCSRLRSICLVDGLDVSTSVHALSWRRAEQQHDLQELG